MKIIQSFWSGGRNMLNEEFGWNSPQSHIMGWALSCLNINNFYSEVELYTDKQGYEILIEQVHLPYSKVHVILEDLGVYPKELWSLAKIKAYSKQNKPFIHIDGDVFIYSKFEDRIHYAQLIAQNYEKATKYYQGKFFDIEKHLRYLPEFMHIDFANRPVCSFNAGIIGGNDLEFFKNYCHEVFDFVDNNIFGNRQLDKHFLINFNILFEQIFFYNLSCREGKVVTCLFDEVFEDNGYKYDDIGDFTTVPYLKTFLHFIGPIKRNKNACDLMGTVLLRDYPEYFFRIASLFEKSFSKYSSQNLKNINLGNLELEYCKNKLSKIKAADENCSMGMPEVSIEKWMTDYFKFQSLYFDKILSFSEASSRLDDIRNAALKYKATLVEILKEFKVISHKYLIASALNSARHFDFFYQPRETQLKRKLLQHSLVRLIETTYDWTILNKNVIPDVIDLGTQNNVSIIIAIVPEIFFPGYKEIVLDEFDCYIFSLMENEISLENLLKELKLFFDPDDIKNNYDNFFQLIMLKLKNLINNKCIKITDEICNELSIG